MDCTPERLRLIVEKIGERKKAEYKAQESITGMLAQVIAGTTGDEKYVNSVRGLYMESHKGSVDTPVEDLDPSFTEIGFDPENHRPAVNQSLDDVMTVLGGI